MDSSPSPSQSSTTTSSSHPSASSRPQQHPPPMSSVPLQPPFPPQSQLSPGAGDLGEWMTDLGMEQLGFGPTAASSPSNLPSSQSPSGAGSDMMDFVPASQPTWNAGTMGVSSMNPLNAGVASMLQSFNASSSQPPQQPLNRSPFPTSFSQNRQSANGAYGYSNLPLQHPSALSNPSTSDQTLSAGPSRLPSQRSPQPPVSQSQPQPPRQPPASSVSAPSSIAGPSKSRQAMPPAKRPPAVTRKSGGSTSAASVPRPSTGKGGQSSQDEKNGKGGGGVLLDGEVDTAGWGVVEPSKIECDRLPILIRGIKPHGAKSRVETQIKMRISILRPSAAYESTVASLPPSFKRTEKDLTPMDVLTPPTSVILGRGAPRGSLGGGSQSSTSQRASLSPMSASESSPERSWGDAGNGNGNGGHGLVLKGPAPYDKVSTYKYLKLQKGVGMKRRGRKTGDLGEEMGEGREDETLWLQTEVWCAESGGRAYACVKCRSRELKRNQTKVSQRVRPSGSDSDDPPSTRAPRTSASSIVTDGSDLTPSQALNMGLDPLQPPPPPVFDPEKEDERHKIMVFNCGPLMELVDGECELPGRVTCYCRHHKEKVGFKIVLNLRDHTGRLVATGTTPPIMITDDHKTSGRVGGASASAAGMSTDGGVSASTSRSKASVASTKSERGKKSRESSVATEDSMAPPSRQAKTKPYDRKPSGDAKPAGSANGAMSPRGTFTPHGLSMTPLHGRSVPSSPAISTANRAGYFSPPTVTVPVQPGSGAITPSLLQGNGSFGAMEYTSRPASPQALAEALPAVADQLSAWAESGGQQNQSYGLMMETNPAQYDEMQVDDTAWAYGNQATNNGIMEQNGLMNTNGFIGDFDMAAPQFPDIGGYAPNGMYYDGFSMDGQQGQNVVPKSYPHALRTMDLDPDFSSMINFSPTTGNQAQLPAASPASASDQYQSPGSSVSNPYSNSYPSPGQYQDPTRSLSQPAAPQGLPQASSPGPPRPVITRLVPAEGPTHGGIEVTVLGENFTPGIVVSFGAFSAVTVQSYGPTTLVCLLPPSPMPGPVAVHVTAVQANGLINAAGSSDLSAPAASFTYQDVSDRKLMEMALTAVGLRVTGKMVGAVEIARRIMSAPQAADGSTAATGSSAQQPTQSNASLSTEDDIARSLSLSLHNSRSTKDFQSAILQFLSVFVDSSTSYPMSIKRRRHEASAINHVNGEGQTILHLAAFMGFEQVVRMLLKSDATVDIHDRNGWTALTFAALGGHPGCVKALLGAGARRAACTFSGETAETIAGKLKLHTIIRLFSSAKLAESHSAKGHKRRVSTSESSLDGDNPSTSDGLSSGRVSDELDRPDPFSPRKLTRPEDVRSVPIIQHHLDPDPAKSDGTVTPTMGPSAPPLSPSPSTALDLPSDEPPPYATLDAASWIHRALQSNIPAPLKDYIPDAVWEKMYLGAAQAQVMIPGLGGVERGWADWESQAWLAMPLRDWMTAFPRPTAQQQLDSAPSASTSSAAITGTAGSSAVETTTGPSAAPTSETQQTGSGEGMRKRHGRRGSGEGRPKIGRRKGSSEVVVSGGGGGKVRLDKRVISEKKPDRMLFLFWLPILLMAFAYTFITTVPVALGKVLFWPILRIIGLLVS